MCGVFVCARARVCVCEGESECVCVRVCVCARARAFESNVRGTEYNDSIIIILYTLLLILKTANI